MHILNADDEDFDVTNQPSFINEDDDEDFDVATQWPSTYDDGDESAPSSVVSSDVSCTYTVL